jgi:ribosomal protein S18 acetylase RimI-like enzyme
MPGSIRPTGPSVRPMALIDVPEVLALWRSTPGIGLTDADSAPALANFFARNADLSLVVVLPNRDVVAAVLCGHDGRRGFLYHLAVAEGHRRQGFARLLVSTCLERLARLGVEKCSVHLFDDNEGGRAFWRHNGWSERGDLRVLQKPTR